MRHAQRRTATDANQAPIVAALRKVGALVWIIGQPFDLLVRWRRQWFVLECKVEGGRLTPAQRRDLQAMFGDDAAVHIVRSQIEAIDAINVDRSGKKRYKPEMSNSVALSWTSVAAGSTGPGST